MRGEPAGDRQDDGIGSEIAGYHPLAIGDRRGKPAGDVAQGDIGDGGIQHFHEGRHHDGERDEPRIEDPGLDAATGADMPGDPALMVWSARGWRPRQVGRFLQKFAGVRACRRGSQIDRRLDREPDEKWRLVRIVVHHIDAHRQPLHDFHEIAGRVLRGQQRQSRAGAHGEAGDASLERPLAAIHVHVEFHALADPQIAELSFLEIRIHPDVAQRADRHEALADLDVVARVHVATGDDAVDLGDDRAVAQIELRLVEIALRLFDFASACFKPGAFLMTSA